MTPKFISEISFSGLKPLSVKLAPEALSSEPLFVTWRFVRGNAVVLKSRGRPVVEGRGTR